MSRDSLILGKQLRPDDKSTKKIVMEYTGPWIVKLAYFKESGKYYSEGEYTSQKLQLFEIFDEVNEMLKNGKLPGLVEGAMEFLVLIDVPDHPHRHPHIVTSHFTLLNPEETS